MNMQEQIRAARRVGVPLIAVTTQDLPCAIRESVAALGNGKGGKKNVSPVWVWDCVAGAAPANDAAAAVPLNLDAMAMPTQAIETFISEAPEKGALVMGLMHRFIKDDPSISQAILHARESLKSNGRTLLWVGAERAMPSELAQDALEIEHSLPDGEERQTIVRELCAAAGVPVDDAITADSARTLAGLSAFAAEQAVALSMSKDGISTDALWERKRKSIEATPGLAIAKVRPGGFAENLRGFGEGIEKFIRSFASNADEAPRCIVFIDEIEKAMAGTAGDLSGTSQDQLGHLLTWWQDSGALGILLIGPPGTGKSEIAKASGSEFRCPVVTFDLGAAKGSLVGQSEERVRQATARIDAISGGRVLVIATCNRIGALPPEMRRRFNLGTFFVDLPGDEARAAIRDLYTSRFTTKGEWPNTDGWTGAEIKQCAFLSQTLGITLEDAARYIVPVSVSAREEIASLRAGATGKYLDAAKGGIYANKVAPSAGARGGSRQFDE